jgi:hypothetical protein
MKFTSGVPGLLPQQEQNSLSTYLSLQTQKRITIDLLQHLRNPHAGPTFATLFDHAFAWSARRPGNAIRSAQLLGMPTPDDDDEEILKAVLRYQLLARRKLPSILDKLAQKKYEPTASPGSADTYMMTLFDNTIREIFIA